MERAVVTACFLLCCGYHVLCQLPSTTTTTTVPPPPPSPPQPPTPTPTAEGFKSSGGAAKVTSGFTEPVPPIKVKPVGHLSKAEIQSKLLLPDVQPAGAKKLHFPDNLSQAGKGMVAAKTDVGMKQAPPMSDTLVFPPGHGIDTLAHNQQSVPKLSNSFETPMIGSGQSVLFNDIFPMDRGQHLHDKPIAKTELVQASTIFDQQLSHIPSLEQHTGSSFKYQRKPASPNPMVSFISINKQKSGGGHSRWPRFKSAVFLSSRPPLYPENTIHYSNWIDLASYRNSAHKNPYSRETPRRKSSDKFMTLLEAGSVANFKDQFRYFAEPATLSKPKMDRPVSVLESLLNDMDLNVDPCEDFYQFACGGFISNSTRTNGVTSKIDEARGSVIKTVAWVLEQQMSKTDPEALMKGKQLYQSCMDETSIESRGLTPLNNFLSDRGGWPVLGLWDPRRFSLADLLARTRPFIHDYSTHFLPTGTIIGLTIQRNFMKPDQYAIYLDQPGLGQQNIGGMPNNEVYKFGKDIIYNEAYEDYLVDLAVALGANPKVARKDMCAVVNFERSLAEIMLPEEDRRLVDKRYTPVSILELSLRYPYFDWFHFIQRVLQHGQANPSVNLSDKVVVWASPYFDRLGKILSKTPTRVLANYVLFRAIQPMLPATNRLVQYINLRYIAVANGAERPQLPKRSNFCAGLVVEHMDWLASRIYIESRLGNDALDKVTAIHGTVKQTLAGLIERAAWLDHQTKQAQLLKLESITDRIGFPVKLLDDKLLNDYYRDFNVTESFFENMETVLSQNYIRLLMKLQVTPLDDWIVRPSTLSVLYNSAANAIEIPAALIQQSFFDMKYSPAMNYGGIGTLIAHAYAHAFDVSGMQFDWTGKLNQIWSNQALNQFGRRANCLIDQYSNFYLPDADLLVVNGNKTLNGNLRDNIAVKTGYYAYQLWKSANQVKELFQLPFTGEQLYFINYARQMCQNASPTYTRKVPYSRLTSVPRLRVIGPLQNSWEFSTAFECPLGTQMNPRNKCYFW